MSEFWHRYWQRLAGARPRPEPAPLNPEPHDDCEAALAARKVIAERDAEIADLRQALLRSESVVMDRREALNRSEATAGDMRNRLANAMRAAEKDAATITAGTERAEQAEATAASLRDDNARLGRTIERAERKLAGLLDPYQISDEEFEAAKAGVTARYGSIPPSLQKVIDMGGRFGLAAARGTEDGFFLLDRAEVEASDGRLAAMTAVLERFAAPGAITVTDRRQAATEALKAAQAPSEPERGAGFIA